MNFWNELKDMDISQRIAHRSRILRYHTNNLRATRAIIAQVHKYTRKSKLRLSEIFDEEAVKNANKN